MNTKGVHYNMSKKLAAAGTVLMVLVQVWCVLSANAEEAKPSTLVVPIQVKATWVWDTTLIITEPTKIMDYAKQQKINLIYLQMDPSLKDASYSSFIKLATAQGIEIHALAGDPHWVQPSEQAHVKEFVNWVKDYNGRVSDKERFRGVHLDVEPYVLPDWKKNRSQLVELWMKTVTLYASEVKGSGLTSSADIPFWLDDIQTSKVAGAPSLDEWMIDKLDQVTIMAYRNMAGTPNGIIALAAHEAVAAKKLRKKIIIAVEALPSKEASYVSFYKKGRTVLTEELQKVEQAMQSNPAFLGYAVHDYKGWRDLKE
jgi:hypothetical protein